MSICREVIEEAAGRPVSDKEAEALLEDMNARAQRLRDTDPSLSLNEALRKAGEDFATQAEMKALAQKRNTLLNFQRRIEAVDYIRNTWGDDPVRGLKALLVGVQKQRIGARASAGTEIDTLRKAYVGGLIADIEKATDGGLDLFKSGAMDDEIAAALAQANSARPNFDGMHEPAVRIAKAIAKWQEVARLNANDAGAFIGKLDGRITKNSHDMIRIAKDQAGWKAAARDTFDLQRMLGEDGGKNAEDVLDRLWQDFADGVHLKVGEETPVGTTDLSGMASGLSQERIVHWKDAAAWSRYNSQFGAGSLRESVVHELERSARATGLMRVFGPNHNMVYDDIVKATLADMKARKADPASITHFAEKARTFKTWHLQNLDGTLDIPGNNALATRSAAVRAIQSMASLGLSTLSSIGDLATMMRGATGNGGSAFEAAGRGLANLFKGVPNAERQALLADLGMAFDSLSGKLASNRFSLDDGARGMTATMQQKFYTLNLQNRWTDSMRQGAAEFLSTNLARRAGVAFDQLPKDLSGTLGLYGIDSGKWDIIRGAEVRDLDGQRFLTPAAVSELGDAPFAKYLSDMGSDASPRAVEQLRRETARQLRGYFNDQNGYMLLTPDFGTTGMMKMGTQRGTPAGEAVRFVMQFKSYSLAFSSKTIGREYGQHGLMGVANLIALTTLFGYVSMAAKDLAKGLQQRPWDDHRTVIAALEQGGGLGIYGDLLFSQLVDRKFTDSAMTVLGPTASDIAGQGGLLDLVSRTLRAGAGDANADPAAASLRFVKSNGPFLNLFYTKLALDYLVFWRLQEMANPGSLDRMQRQMEANTGRQYLVAPSQAIHMAPGEYLDKATGAQ